MSLVLESGYTSLNKCGEELCGDRVETVEKDGYKTVVLADGLGSGVKANILATLTSKILCTLISENIPLEECMETILGSLPVCKVRKIAYSTFSIVHTDINGKGYIIEFDNPAAILLSGGKCRDLEREEMTVLGKTLYKSDIKLLEGDTVILMSDGVIHAGIGKTLNFGWQREDVKRYLENVCDQKMSARGIACMLASACSDLYLMSPGDDATVAAVKARNQQVVSVFVGPPVRWEDDGLYVKRFMETPGKKVVCGGTSSQIVARYLNAELIAAFDFPDENIPPIGYIDGIDLTTEGVLTLRKLLALSDKYLSVSDLSPKFYAEKDGASLLAQMLFETATDIIFFVGQGVNAAHQGLPIDTTMKLKLCDRIAQNLKKMGKNVQVNYD